MNMSIWTFLDRMGFEMFHYLLSVLWQSSLLFTGVFLLLYFLRKRGAGLRHKFLFFALLLSPFLPLLTIGIQRTGAPQKSITVMSSYQEPPPVSPEYSKPYQSLSTKSPAIIETEILQPITPNPQPALFTPTHYPWAFAGILYGIGVAFFLGWVIMGRLRIRRWRLDAVPCTNERVLEIFHKARKSLGLERNLLILESGHVPIPLSLGTIHPAIFLPENLESHISDEELTAIAFHETAHIKRRDPLILNLAALVRAVLFFHPLVWAAVRQISSYAEMCADDAALEQTGQPLSYAKLLTRFSENLPKLPLATEMATGLLFTKSAFLKRVEAILGDRPRLQRLSRFALIASLMAILVSLFLSLSFPLKVGGFAEETKREGKISPKTAEIFQGKDMSLQGSVTDEQGNLLEGVKIVNWFPFGSNPQETWTNSRGIYYFKTRRGYVVKAFKEGYAPAFEEFRDKYNKMEEKNDPMFANITMNKGGIVDWRIIDKSSGNPLEGAKILVYRKARDLHVGNLPYDIWTSEQITTNKEGRFSVELVPTGLVKIRAEADGYKSEESGYLDLEKGKTKSFEISLEKMTSQKIREKNIEEGKQEKRDRSLNGVVKDSSQNPLDGVKISNFFPQGSMPQETFTNARGEFRFERERGYVLIAEKKGYAPSFYEFRDKYNQNRGKGKYPLPVEMVMTKGGRVSGIIRSERDNNPIPNAKVWFNRWGKDPDVGVNRYIIWKSQSVKADERGRFHLENAPDGALRLHAEAEGFAENISPEFALDPESQKEMSLDLYPGMDVKILVLDKERQTPIEGVEIWFSEKGSSKSDQEGVCLFPNVSIGNYWIKCTAQSYHEMTLKDIAIEEKQGEKELRLLLLPAK